MSNKVDLEQLTILDETTNVTRCCECGRVIRENEDSYACRTHRILCKDCLLMLHKRYV